MKKNSFALAFSAAIIISFNQLQLQAQTSYSGTSGSAGCTPAASTSGVSNTFIGCGAALSNNGAKLNVAVGDSALYNQNYSNAGAAWNSYNVAVGNQALFSNLSTATTNGIKCTGVGFKALRSNTTGNSNTGVGLQAGFSNTTASENVFIGVDAGYFNATGSYHTICGYQAGLGTATGNVHSANSFFGYQAGYGITTGGDNVFMGFKAGYTNNSGTGSTFIGDQAGFLNTTGNYNTGLGHNALYSNTSGHSNVAVGSAALYFNTTGIKNTVIGYEANSYTTTTSGSGNAIAGYQAAYKNATGNYNAIMGYQAGYNTNSSNNSFYGFGSGLTTTTGANNTCIGYGADVNANNYSNATALGNGAIATATNTMYLGNANVTSVASAVGSWSDKRFKFNVQEDVKGLEFIRKLRPVTYQFDTKKYEEFVVKDAPDSIKTMHMNAVGDCSSATAKVHSGFIAQEVEQVAKDCGFKNSIVNIPADTNKSAYTLAYAEIVVPLVKAVQQLDSTVTALQNKLNSQRLMQNNNDEQVKTATTIHDVELASGTAIIYQNVPNPFGDGTMIKYFIPENANAQIVFFDEFGNKLREFNVTEAGMGQLNVTTSNLAAGMYSYSLIMNGKVVETKKMIKN